MSEEVKAPTLLFVKNFAHQIGPVEKFLKKRGFNVVIEMDIKSGMDRILEINPEYIFLAWDHKNENIRMMPKTIYQSCTGQVVPFIMSTQRDQIIQLESSGFENKLYPPLSGPAIMRVISKYEKKAQIFQQIDKKPSTAKKESSMIQVKSFFKDENDEGPEINLKRTNSVDEGERQMIASRSRGRANMFMPQQNRKSSGMNRATSSGIKNRSMAMATQDGIKAKMMMVIEEEFSKHKKLTREQKEAAKKNLMKTLEQQLAQEDINPMNLILAIEEEIAKMSELNPEEQKKTKGKLIEIMDAELSKAMAEMEAEFAKSQDGKVDRRNNGEQMPEIDYDNEEDNKHMSELLPRETKNLTKEQIDYLDESFAETIRPDLLEVVEANAEQESQQLDLKTTTQIYIMVVQELEWTGYLAVASESYLDMASAQDILNNWVKTMIRIEQIDQNETDEEEVMPDAVLMEIRVPKVDFADFCGYKSEFFKDIEYKGKKTMLGFFSFSPYHVINSVHVAHDMLELPTEFLQPNKELPFDVNLYLQENKKFILYIRPGSFLEENQVERLITRKAKYIFSHMEYELPLLKYKAEFNIKGLIEAYNKNKGSKE